MSAVGSLPQLQIHPTRRCNLSCRHCYTASGPEVRETLPAGLLLAAISDAAELGYRQLGVSGGEPLLYDALPSLLSEARACGMVTTFTTNGLLLSEKSVGRLAGVTDFVAVSLDGTRASHDAMRGRIGAFDAAVRNLRHLRDAGIPFGVITTLTQHNLDELAELADLVEAEGALLLQVHPLDLQGRAALQLPGANPDAVELVIAMCEVLRLGEDRRLVIHLDALLKEHLVAQPERFLGTGQVGSAHLADWIPSLVVQSDGAVVPITHGMDTAHALGWLEDAPLRELAAWWHAERAEEFASACRRAYVHLTRPSAPPVTYWYEALSAAIRSPRRIPLTVA
jgi:Fe-coproporphyrin III synthase